MDAVTIDSTYPCAYHVVIRIKQQIDFHFCLTSMFQPQLNNNVYRSLRQRLCAIERLIENDVDVNLLTRASNQLQQVAAQTLRLQTGLSEESRSSIDDYCSRLRQLISVIHIDVFNFNGISAITVIGTYKRKPGFSWENPGFLKKTWVFSKTQDFSKKTWVFSQENPGFLKKT